jgi:2-polyprenyl-3-methyl-5-hydroxy-6-metoxy-1,4-benzoquinol methylase
MRGRLNRNIHYHDVVLNAVPARCERALDVGCGIGQLAAALAHRCDAVLAIDADASALARARAAYPTPNLQFLHADVMRHAFEKESFDFVASIATLHHLPLEPALERFKSLVRPRGTLALIGLYRLSTLTEIAYAHVAVPVSAWHRVTKGSAPVGAPVQDAKETFAEVQAAAERILPSAEFRRLLLFRYALLWHKP